MWLPPLRNRWALSVLALLGIGFYLLWQYTDVLGGERRNEAASCANCRSFIQWTLRGYASEHDGWYPRGGETPLDSLAVAIKEREKSPRHRKSTVGQFTSHALRGEALRYWEEHETLSQEITCYRYNEGLHKDDPLDLIVMYFHEPTKWECSKHKMEELGRPVMGGDMTWDFINEEEFQRRQKETLSYLEKRREAQSRDAHLKELLKLQAELTEITEGGGHGLRLDLQMNGTAPLELTVAGKVALTIVTPGKKGERVSTHIRTFRREPDRRSLKLSPGERGAVLRYPGTDGPKIGSDSTVQARCWVNSIGSTKVRDSVVLTAESRTAL